MWLTQTLLDGPTLYSHREEAVRDQLQQLVPCGLWVLPCSPAAPGRWSVPTHCPLCCRWRTPCPPCPEQRAVGSAGCCMTQRLKQNKEVHVKPRTGKDIPKHRDMAGPGCGSSLCLCEKIFWAQHTFLGGYLSGDKCSVCLSQRFLCRARKSSFLGAGEGSLTLFYELFLIVSISLTIGLEV